MTITLFSCIQEEKTKNLRIIDLAGTVGKTSVVNLSEIAESIDYIPLETNDEALLSPPLMNLNFVNGKLYISQFRTEIKIFNQDGSFIKIFNKKGRGPQEYESLSDFYIDPLSSDLLIYSHRK
ncbi:MAG: 6-bladed beta-propeller [Bacteroidales bacterium]|nr:6-bladed beta-propeller [Bacteroidales bacterium]